MVIEMERCARQECNGVFLGSTEDVHFSDYSVITHITFLTLSYFCCGSSWSRLNVWRFLAGCTRRAAWCHTWVQHWSSYLWHGLLQFNTAWEWHLRVNAWWLFILHVWVTLICTCAHALKANTGSDLFSSPLDWFLSKYLKQSQYSWTHVYWSYDSSPGRTVPCLYRADVICTWPCLCRVCKESNQLWSCRSSEAVTSWSERSCCH